MSSDSNPLTEIVQTDPDLLPVEKEMTIGFSKEDEYCWFNVDIASVVRRAINHTDIKVEKLKIKPPEGHAKTIDFSDDLTPDDIEGTVVGAIGQFPIGLLKIQGSPRARNTFAPVISPQEAPASDAFD
jgi:hypothetical protein